MALLDRLRTFVDGGPVPHEGTPRGAESALYRCDVCDVTYIAAEMDGCPECDGSVEEIPSASELGIGPDAPR